MEKLGDDATIFVKNENKLNQMLHGNQILKSLALLAKVELVDGNITEAGSIVNPRSMGDDRWMYEDGVRLPAAEEDMRRSRMPDTGDENTVFAETDEDYAQYSISEIEGQNGNYGMGVLLDTNIFDGVRTRNWGEVLSKYVHKHLAGAELTMYDEAGNAETVYLARENDRVKKDGAKNSHKVISYGTSAGGDGHIRKRNIHR